MDSLTGHGGLASYGPADAERWLPEEHSSRRSDFARDRARLLHSSALRRLAAKTQVLSPTTGLDFARNRLTHSLEVAQVGRELADSLGLDPDVVDTACLAHDIGHPPFGHNGETAINAWAADIGGFEGNAQTLRLLTRIEPKLYGEDGRPYGLNLTRASLDASCKYPWPAAQGVLEPSSGRRKFGFYDDDVDAFTWLRSGAPRRQRCIEAQVMDLSDDIAYSVHDFEDAVVAGFIDVAALGDRVGENDIVSAMHAWVGDTLSRDELLEAFDRLRSLSLWMTSYDGSRVAQARLKNLTSQFIGRFARTATQATRASYASGSLVRFAASVVVPPEIIGEIAVLKGIVAAFVMTQGDRQPVYERQRAVLTELLDALVAAEDRELEPGFAADWRAATDDAGRRRAVVDQVASLTDQGALAWHKRLVAGVRETVHIAV
ncbi:MULTISPECIES: deoxyguanosinetriphosphate triphosphohydrolase [unclassified Curtobacterium]|uniref:deoxyguanosinetriphosphate triphosphohydrolase n=1 Tax=unclassified Curtobacterium TaxID=257496 RepID=UPI000DA8BFE4|nr:MULTISPECIES: deoxyguanosinetriphosphate triphosphohydrolase [unclassified Curtobacterium]PZE74486.1 deoxyguanosinetriphosphate triphosphohydrolase [Curtobacterium sp. MCBD17_019]WIB64834.1 deoxyguanosinetriphosphate triphosphohydrolase [Curtobacterium sp. MCBD17_040]WIB68677.1 deoxyguanosinetriphosphate triphosphohydrolase [Curtobacterium sp. MCBD17_035]